MISGVSASGARLRLFVDRWMTRLGLGEDAFLLGLAFLIGVVTAAAAVAFHELIQFIRNHLYANGGEHFLYGRGIWLLIALPAAGGLCVGLLARYVFHEREGHGMVDVMESVMRSGGVIRVRSAFEKILTSAITIGSGGSAGAEGPIVQIGAAIASGVGQAFRVAKPHLPVLIGCGSAAGISAIFNSPIGGLLFTLEVILRDFSIRTLTPLVIASVIANFTTRSIFIALGHTEEYRAIFNMPAQGVTGYTLWTVGNFILLGIVCGLVGVALTRLMYGIEHFFGKLKIGKEWKPALGGAMLGVMGVLYVLAGRLLIDRPKFIPFQQYPMPSFFGDGYGAVRAMLGPAFYGQMYHWQLLVVILVFLCIAKVVGTCLTLGSGGAGGVIAPSLFIGAVTGGALGMMLQHMHLSHTLPPEAYALIGMGAVLSAIVHAPLASVLILVEVTGDFNVMLPAMLATIIGTGVAQMISKDSIYTLSLRMRGVRVGTGNDLTLLRRMTLEQIELEPATFVRMGDPLEKALNQTLNSGAIDLVVIDGKGAYSGMMVSEDIRAALFDREAVPLLLVDEIMRSNVPLLRTNDSLATVLDQFSAHDVSRLPVVLPGDSRQVIGVASRAALMRRYQRVLEQT